MKWQPLKRVPVLQFDGSYWLRDTRSYPVAVVKFNGPSRDVEWSDVVRLEQENGRRLAASWNALRKWPLEEIERVAEKGIKCY